MKNNGAFFVLAFAALALAASGGAFASTGFDAGSSDAPPMDDTTNPDQRLAAFLAMIRQFESSDDYSVIFGGQHFSDFSQHPRIRVYFTDPRTGRQNWSDAAGAYQFISTTWAILAARLGLTDFSPESQDAAAVELLREVGALASLNAGDFKSAVARASTQWASLPGSTAMQNPQTYQAALDTFNSYVSA